MGGWIYGFTGAQNKIDLAGSGQSSYPRTSKADRQTAAMGRVLELELAES